MASGEEECYERVIEGWGSWTLEQTRVVRRARASAAGHIARRVDHFGPVAAGGRAEQRGGAGRPAGPERAGLPVDRVLAEVVGLDGGRPGRHARALVRELQLPRACAQFTSDVLVSAVRSPLARAIEQQQPSEHQ